jgi:ketosteroid isomerase-like protein
MHPNARLIEEFYAAFAARDAARMVACYGPGMRFCDPVFPALRGAEVEAMWSMLCARGKDLRVRVSNVQADDLNGSAHWDADYTFSGTGRPVHNSIDAAFLFREGRIVEHVDEFDLARWAGMALGLKGRLLGWTDFMQDAIRKQADAGLRAWMEKQARAGAQ